jgi:hypothetical protein
MPTVDYIYDDHVQEELPDLGFGSPTINVNVGYRLFKKDLGIFNLGLEKVGYVRILNSSGYILIEVPDDIEDESGENKKVSNAVHEWEIGKIEIIYADGDRCELEIHEHSSNNRLPVNQIVVKPVNMNLFKALCFYKGDIIQLNHVYTYEKRSFGETTSGDVEEIEEYANPSAHITQTCIGDIAKLSGGGEGSEYGLRKYSTGKVIGAVFKGRSGRSIGQSKTKMLTWVKQPYCPDVEIRYSWKANYDKFELHPCGCTCVGPVKEVVLGSTNYNKPDHTKHYYMPECGDHNTHFFRKTGTMWYPYIQCAYFASYNIIDQYTYSVGIMGAFTETDSGGNYIHGKHDLRMLGPPDHQAWNCGIPCWFSACPCDVVPCNAHKVGENIFVGYARIRSSVSDYELAFWAEYGDTLPKFTLDFDKVYRPFLRSYRAMDHVDYYFYTGGFPPFVKKWRWMPSYMFFSEVDITQRLDMYESYDSDAGVSLHPFSMFRADTTIDNVLLRETVDNDHRYKFEQIFRVLGSSDLAYPRVDGIYTQYTKENRPWFEFLSYPENPSKTIHWAWREEWSLLKRSVKSTLQETLSYQEDDLLIKGPFVNSIEYGTHGKFIFLDIQYPDYRYDAYLKEFQLTCDEGSEESPCVIKFIAPEKNDYGEYEGYPKIQLNNGKERCFDWDGVWDPEDGVEDECNKELYETCTEDPWVSNVTIFDTGYDDKTTVTAKNEGREIITQDDFGDEVKTYFQRGLNITIDSSKFSYLPLQLEKADQYNIKYNRVGDFEIYEDETEGLVDEWLTTTELFNQDNSYITYTCSGIGYHVEISHYFDEKLRRIGKVKLSCFCGFEKIEATKDEPEKKILYHLPQISIYKASNGGEVIGNLLYQSNGMVLYNESNEGELVVKEYMWNNIIADMKDGFDSVIVRLRVAPTESEKANYNLNLVYNNYYHAVRIDSIELYDETLVDAVEYIIPRERKYYVSYGDYGDHPPQGDGTHRLLRNIPKDYSTTWQKDSEQGIVGLENSGGELEFMNKCRGRFVYDIIEDKTPLPTASDLARAEKEQSRLHNMAAFEKGSSTFFLSTCTPPGLKEYLENNDMSNPFESWEGVRFINDIIFPLATLNEVAPYSPGGHSWIPSDPYINRVCGPETFSYDYFNHDTGNAGQWSANAHWTYYWGTYWIMQRREIADFVYRMNAGRGYGVTVYSAFADELTDLIGFAA